MTQSSKIANKYITAAEICRKFGISVKTLDRWIKKGKISKPQIYGKGSTRRWPADEVKIFQ